MQHPIIQSLRSIVMESLSTHRDGIIIYLTTTAFQLSPNSWSLSRAVDTQMVVVL